MLPVLWFLTYIVDVADYMKVCGIEEVEMRKKLFSDSIEPARTHIA